MIVCRVRVPLHRTWWGAYWGLRSTAVRTARHNLCWHFHLKCGRYQLTCSLHIHRLNFMTTTLPYILSEKMCVLMNACHFVPNLSRACCGCRFACLLSVTRTLSCFSISKYNSLLSKNLTILHKASPQTLLGCHLPCRLVQEICVNEVKDKQVEKTGEKFRGLVFSGPFFPWMHVTIYQRNKKKLSPSHLLLPLWRLPNY